VAIDKNIKCVGGSMLEDSVRKELIYIQKMVLSGDMSDTDLANWFFQFCDEQGCGTSETYESMKGKSFNEETEEFDNIEEEEAEEEEEEEVTRDETFKTELKDGYIVGFGSIKGNKCKTCGRVFEEGEIYADKGEDSLCSLCANDSGILHMNKIIRGIISKQRTR